MQRMKQLIRAALYTPTRWGWGHVLGFEGSPGVGKSFLIEGMCGELGLVCETLSPGERGEAAFGVVPVPEDGFLEYPPPSWVAKFAANKGRGLVFIDELTTAPPAWQPPLLGLTLAGRIGAAYLGPGVRRMCAYNPPASAAAGYDLAKAQANRLCHVKWDAGSATDWGNFLISGDGLDAFRDDDHRVKDFDAVGEEKRVLAAWPTEFAKAAGMITAFVERRPALLHSEPADNTPGASAAWPSRRTWDLATYALAGARIHELDDDTTLTWLGGYVGMAAANEFFDSIYKEALPDPARLLDGKEEFKHEHSRPDRTHAVLSSCVALVTPENAVHRDKRTRALWELIGKLVQNADTKAMTVVSAQRMATAKLFGFAEAKPTLIALGSVLDSAVSLAKK